MKQHLPWVWRARLTQDPQVKKIIYDVQNELYYLMAELATTPENYEKMGFRMTAEHVHRLEQVEETLKQEVEIPNKFIVPGDSPDGAALDIRAHHYSARGAHGGKIAA